MVGTGVRGLTPRELVVLREVQVIWGSQNTLADVFFTDCDEAAMFVKARDGESYVMVDLTNLARLAC